MKHLFAILALSLVFAAPVSAQTADSTPEPAPVVIADDTPAVDTAALLNFALYLLLAIAGGGSFALVLMRLDARGKDQLEKAYLSLPPDTQQIILRLVDLTEALAKLGRDVTDGVPSGGATIQTRTPKRDD